MVQYANTYTTTIYGGLGRIVKSDLVNHQLCAICDGLPTSINGTVGTVNKPRESGCVALWDSMHSMGSMVLVVCYDSL
jgi:hypothetical protein